MIKFTTTLKKLLFIFSIVITSTQLYATLPEAIKIKKAGNGRDGWVTDYNEGNDPINETMLKGRKIYQIRYKKADGSYQNGYHGKIKTEYCMALTPEEACLKCKNFFDGDTITQEAIDITHEFSRKNPQTDPSKKHLEGPFLRTSFRELELSAYENKLTDNRYFLHLTKDDEIYACNGNHFLVKKGTDPQTVLRGEVSEESLAQITNVTAHFTKDGECIAYQEIYPENYGNANRFLALPNRYRDREEKKLSINSDTHQIIEVKIGVSNDTHYYMIPKVADITTALAGLCTPEQFNTAKDITNDYSPKGYIKNPDFSLYQIWNLLELTIDKVTKKTYFGDVELTSLPTNCLILNYKDRYFATSNEEAKTAWEKHIDGTEPFERLTDMVPANANFDFTTGAFKETASAILPPSVQSTSNANSRPAVTSIKNSKKNPQTTPGDNKNATLLSKIQTHKTALLAGTGTLSMLGLLALAYKRHIIQAKNAKKTPMKLHTFITHVIKNPRKFPKIFAGLGLITLGATASYLIK